MGSITPTVIGNTKSITQSWEVKPGKKLIEIDRVRDGKVLTFSAAASGHTYSAAQIIHEFEAAKHFSGVNGNGIVDAHINTPMGTINPTQTTGLSNGDIIQLRIGYTGGDSGPATIPYTIPAGTFTSSAGKNLFTGTFLRSGPGEVPHGRADQKEQEYMRLTTVVGGDEFSTQYRLTGINLPHVLLMKTGAFRDSDLKTVQLPVVEEIDNNALHSAKNAVLRYPELKKLGSGNWAFIYATTIYMPKLQTASGTITGIHLPKGADVTLPYKWNRNSILNGLIGNWFGVKFHWVMADGSIWHLPHDLNDGTTTGGTQEQPPGTIV